jgi:hypothetical protein
MPDRGDIIYMDACGIEGAHGTNCWKALHKNFKLKTEELCLQEVTQPDKMGNRLVLRDETELRSEVECSKCSAEAMVELTSLLHDVADLDDGELHLLTLALEQQNNKWHICGPDVGTLRALLTLSSLGKNVSMDNMCALETLTKTLGLRTSFDTRALRKLSEKWLQKVRMELLTGQR